MKIKKLLAFTLVLATLISMFAVLSCNVFASTSGGTGSYTITVNTKANYLYPGASSVTLKQEKQTLTYKALTSNKTKTKTGYYGCYNITVYNVANGSRSSVYWGGGQTKKISLDPNCTYRITVSYNSTSTALFTSQPLGYSWKSSSNPYWRVSSTWKISSYS